MEDPENFVKKDFHKGSLDYFLEMEMKRESELLINRSWEYGANGYRKGSLWEKKTFS